MAPDVPNDRVLRRTKERRWTDAVAALVEMTGQQGPVVAIDNQSLDFLVNEISHEMMLELRSRWAAFQMGYPSTSRLVALTEIIHLHKAVVALDG
jgi:hypothetical protein